MVHDPQIARRHKLEKRLYRMLQRNGFGDVYREDGSVIRRKLGQDFYWMVEFAMQNNLDHKRSSEIYELYAVWKRQQIEQMLECQRN